MAAQRLARQLFAQASDLLARRWHGRPAAGEDWLCPQALRALRLPLQAGPEAVLSVVLRDGVSPRAVPRRWQGLPLRPERGGPARAQATAPELSLRRNGERGTATALVRDRLNGERCYLLTCAHVVAPDRAARWGDAVRLHLPGADAPDALLREWQPAVGPGCQPSALDAALIELDDGGLQLLQQTLGPAWLPRGLGDALTLDMPVALQRIGGATPGRLCEHWSGEVGAGGSDYPDYFLQDAIAYASEEPTTGGDSGAALWGVGDQLLGMHIGAIENGRTRLANAVMARAKPALDWYCVKLFTRDDPATLTAADWPAPPPGSGAEHALAFAPAPKLDGGDEQVLAKTLWGEARGEGRSGMEAVAAVIINRWAKRYRACQSVTEVCLDPWQFSCWNAKDPNRRHMENLRPRDDPDFDAALLIAGQALRGAIDDPTLGAKHYVSTSLPAAQRPDWLLGKRPCRVIGRHEFYNDIR